MSGRRVAKLEIENFKGFQGKLELDLDAEIVLLVGPNGRGKTSTIEALELVTTGTIGRRVGGKGEFDFQDFIHCNRNTGERRPHATIRATWADNSGVDQVVIQQSSKEPIEAKGPWASQREQTWRNESEADLVRACTFLYSDSLGSLAGLDLDARRQVIDFFVPSFSRLDDLTEHEAPLLSAQIADSLRRLEASLPNVQQLLAKEARHAVAAQDALNAIGELPPFKFTKKGPALVEQQKLGRALKDVCTYVGIPLPSGDGYQEQLLKISKAAIAKADLLESSYKIAAQKESRAHGAWAAIQSTLHSVEQNLRQLGWSGFPSSEQLKVRRQTLLTHDALRRRRDAVEKEYLLAGKEVETIVREEVVDGLPTAPLRVAIGTIPVLKTLLSIDSSASLPTWWAQCGLPAPDPARFAPLLEQEQQRYAKLLVHRKALSSTLLEIDSALDEVSALDNRIEPLLTELLSAWSETGRTDSLPLRPDGCIAVDEIHQAAAAAIGSIGSTSILPESQLVSKWRLVAKTFSEWTLVHEEVLRGAKVLAERQECESARQHLQSLKEIIDHVASNRAGCFKDVLRARVAELKYEQELNVSIRRILRWYAHRRDVIENARIEFHRHGPLQVRIGPAKLSTGIASLSRSQLTSLAFGLAITANLGRPSLPTGFLCLDDVSDAFDLDNLAADAAMLRLLAYGTDGNGSRGRRQLVLTNHNDQLTDRIVPLLLPPAGRRMRIIEFIDDGHDRMIKAKQWEVLGEKRERWDGISPFRTLLPPTRRTTESAAILSSKKP